MAKLFNARTTDGNGDKVPLAYPTAPVYGTTVYYTIYVWGTFDSATVQIQVSPDQGTTWFDVPGLAFTAKDVRNLEVSGTHVRAVLSNDGASTSVSAEIL